MSDQAADPYKGKWNLAIQRMGEGFAGRLAEGDKARAAQEQLRYERDKDRRAEAAGLSKERIVSAARDAQGVLSMLEMGAPDRALQLIDSRLGFLDQLNADPSDTLEIKDRILRGDIEGAIGELKLVTTNDQIRGLIEPLVSVDQQVKLDKQALEEDQYRQDYGQDPSFRTNGAGGAPTGATGKSTGGIKGAELRMAQDKAAREAAAARREETLFKFEQQRLPPDLLPAYMKAGENAEASLSAASEMGQLLADFKALGDIKTGVNAAFDETLKEFWGEEDAVSIARQRFRGIVNAQVMQNLPPGVASDKDIELARSGYPTGNPSKENIESFLRGGQKVMALQAAYEAFKSDYIDENRMVRGVNKAWKENAEDAFQKIKAEMNTPLRASYTIPEIDAAIARKKAEKE